MNLRRKEVEAKFFVGKNLSSAVDIEQKLMKSGFVYAGGRIETDFLPDTNDDLLKKNKILLRFRLVSANGNDFVLLTLKIRKENKLFTEFEETEFNLSEMDGAIFNYINSIIEKKLGVKLSKSIVSLDTIEAVRNYCSSIGLSRTRILLDKYRQEYKKSNIVACIDYFPDQMGLYLELEAYDSESLKNSVSLLGFKENEIITTDYGDLLKIHKSNLPDDLQRKAVFLSEERERFITN